MRELSISEWETISTDTVTKMIDHAKKYITPISQAIAEDAGKHLGTGSYFDANNRKFIITNEHVAMHLQNNTLTHQFLDNENILKITNPSYSIPSPADVAISHIDQDSWNMFNHSSMAIPLSRFAQRHDPVQNELLFFAGYSGERSRFLFGNLISRGTPYLTQESPFPDSVEEANSILHFALHYPPDLARSIDGTSHLPDPHGFSGSLVWDTSGLRVYRRTEIGLLKWQR